MAITCAIYTQNEFIQCCDAFPNDEHCKRAAEYCNNTITPDLPYFPSGSRSRFRTFCSSSCKLILGANDPACSKICDMSITDDKGFTDCCFNNSIDSLCTSAANICNYPYIYANYVNYFSNIDAWIQFCDQDCTSLHSFPGSCSNYKTFNGTCDYYFLKGDSSGFIDCCATAPPGDSTCRSATRYCENPYENYSQYFSNYDDLYRFCDRDCPNLNYHYNCNNIKTYNETCRFQNLPDNSPGFFQCCLNSSLDYTCPNITYFCNNPQDYQSYFSSYDDMYQSCDQWCENSDHICDGYKTYNQSCKFFLDGRNDVNGFIKCCESNHSDSTCRDVAFQCYNYFNYPYNSYDLSLPEIIEFCDSSCTSILGNQSYICDSYTSLRTPCSFQTEKLNLSYTQCCANNTNDTQCKTFAQSCSNITYGRYNKSFGNFDSFVEFCDTDCQIISPDSSNCSYEKTYLETCDYQYNVKKDMNAFFKCCQNEPNNILCYETLESCQQYAEKKEIEIVPSETEKKCYYYCLFFDYPWCHISDGDESSSTGSSLSNGAIAGIVIGVALLFGVLVALIMYFVCVRNSD